jgi:two-component system chemotaxis response regulator CheB
MSKVKRSIELLTLEKAAATSRKESHVHIEANPIEIVAVASSTGGPPAIQAILSSLPPDFGAAIVIAQHMPPGFTTSFAERLNKLSALSVCEAGPGGRLRPGTVTIAPGGFHLIVKRDGAGLFCQLDPKASSDKYVPSADQMMASAADVCGPATLGVVLTGMGKDGAEGVRRIREKEGQCIAENEESAVIFGMPREAIKTGCVEKVLPLGFMAAEIIGRCGGARSDSEGSGK